MLYYYSLELKAKGNRGRSVVCAEMSKSHSHCALRFIDDTFDIPPSALHGRDGFSSVVMFSRSKLPASITSNGKS